MKHFETLKNLYFFNEKTSNFLEKKTSIFLGSNKTRVDWKIWDFVLKITTFRALAIYSNFTEYCACHEKWPSNLTKCCPCHEKWCASLIVVAYETSFIQCAEQQAPQNQRNICRKRLKRQFQCGDDSSMIRPWSNHELVISHPPFRRGYFSRFRDAFCIENYNISRAGYLLKFHRILRLPRKVTLQDHQMLRLPRKVTLQDHQMLRLPRKVTLRHHQILRLPRKVRLSLNSYWTELLRSCYWAVTKLLLNCYWTGLLLNCDWTDLLLSCYTELLLNWAVTELSCYLTVTGTQLLLVLNCYWTELLLSCYWTVTELSLNCDWTDLLLSCYTELLLNWAVTELSLTQLLLVRSCYWTELLLNCYWYSTVTGLLLNCYWTDLLLSCYWIVTFTALRLELLLYWTLCIFKSP